MRILDAARTAALLPFERLVPALREAFVAGAEVPLRHRHDIGQPDGTTAALLLMPAWQANGLMGAKVVSVFPGNGARGLASVSASYLLCDGATGQHLALIDGGEITRRRTAAASALAGSFLARKDAASLLIVGSGHVGGLLAEAYRVVRPIERVMVWNIRPAGAERLAARLVGEAVTDLAAAVRQADIVSCATLSREPLVQGEWLRPGTHLDLIGGFTPAMREADDAAVRRARVFIDTDAALAEAGDLIDPIAHGVLRSEDVAGTLFSLCRGETAGRRDAREITLFKSVGSALEDLAAAGLAYAGEAACGKLDGKAAIVTGAARGLGRAYARRLAGLGAKVAVADLNLKSFEEFEAEAQAMTADGTVAEIEAAGGSAIGIEVDVCDEKAVVAMVQRVVAEWGRVDVLVANAGGGRGRPVDTRASTLDPALLHLVVSMNLFGTVYCCNAVAPIMKQQRSGKIVTVSSVAGLSASSDGDYAHYGAAKAAIAHYTRYLAQDLGPYGITANCIAPGTIATGRIMATVIPGSANANRDRTEQIALRRLGTVEDCAKVVEFLTTDLSDYVSGTVIPIDGGLLRS